MEKSFQLETAFRATFNRAGEGPCSPLNVAVLCEYDALPEVGHACGHNLIAEVGIAAAVGIKAAMEASTRGLGQVGLHNNAVHIQGLPWLFAK